MRFCRVVSLLAIWVGVVGCTLALRPGAFEGAAPPRLITLDGKAGWDNPAAFGPVPAELQATGDAICSSMNTRWRRFHATGYHSRAQDINGEPFAKGAYYCE